MKRPGKVPGENTEKYNFSCKIRGGLYDQAIVNQAFDMV